MNDERKPATIGERLASVARRLPDKIAISDGDSGLSYAELDVAADAVARTVIAAAGRRTGAVCLLFEDRLEAIRAIFGTGRTGRPYVPLDARDPDQRLRFIARDCEPAVLVTEAALLKRARSLAPEGCPVVDASTSGPGADTVAIATVAPEAIVYLFYTSGSTGRPKGVSQSHRNLLFFADAYATTLGIRDDDRLSLLYSLSFSAANMDIFGGMLNGATLLGYDMRRDGIPLLADWLDRERISVLHAVPTVFRELFASLAPDRMLSHLRAIDLGGEAVFGSDVELFRQHTLDGCVLVNHLAATEASVIAQHVVDHRSGPVSGILAVGQTPPGLTVAIRREDGQPAQIGEAGQIVVSSAHVSPGYWRRPKLNSATFATDRRSREMRHYSSGDLGRIDAEGSLHFLGRSGNRVKIHGYSIDLAEVEAAVSAAPGVLKSAALPRGEPGLEPDRIVAYIVAAQGAPREPAALRRFLAARLPSYMLPRSFLFVDRLPVTATGKIDRRALEAIAFTQAEERGIDPPRNESERVVAAIFQALLKQPAIGRDDDFFLLGGDSLSVVELQTRLRDAFKIALPGLLEDTTVAGIAAQIAAAGGQGTATLAIPILRALRERGSAPPLFLVHGRLGQALVSSHLLQLLGEDQPVWAFQARGLDGLRAPHPTIEAMAVDYLAEMRRQRPQGPYFIGSLCAGAFIAVEMARSLRAENETVLPLLLLDPPERAFAMDDLRLTEEHLLARLRHRSATGSIEVKIDDPIYAKASVRVARAFEHAIRKFGAKPYDGPVFMFSSNSRKHIGTDPAGMRGIYTGRLERFEVARRHSEILDARNPLFAKHLAYCLNEIHEAAVAERRGAVHYARR